MPFVVTDGCSSLLPPDRRRRASGRDAVAFARPRPRHVGSRRPRTSSGISRCCATTCAGTAQRCASRRLHASSSLAGTRWRSPMRSACRLRVLRPVDRRDDRPVDRRRTRGDAADAPRARQHSPRAWPIRRRWRARRQTVLAAGHGGRRPTRRWGGSSRRPPSPPSAAGRVGAPRAARDRSGRLRRLLRRGARSESGVDLLAASARRRSSSAATSTNRCPGTATATCCPRRFRARGRPAARGALSNLERPRSFTAALFDFLLPKAAGTVEAGLADPARGARRRARRSQHRVGTTDFTRDFQELITRFAWGTIWARPGLDHRTRRLLVLAITAALGRWEEFRLHVRTGLAHELEPCDLEGSAAAGRGLRGRAGRQHGFSHRGRGELNGAGG